MCDECRETLRAVLTEAGLQAHTVGCPNRLKRPRLASSTGDVCPGCSAETLVAKPTDSHAKTVTVLVKALKRYGQHELSCELHSEAYGECTCGLDRETKRAAISRGSTPETWGDTSRRCGKPRG